MPELYAIVGLGNPGLKYAHTRHNLGFITLDRFAEKEGIKITKNRFLSLTGEAFFGGKKLLLAKPQTFMNNSGEAVRQLTAYYAVPHDHLLLLYDDIDIPEGTLRIRKGGSAGTHNGMRSVIRLLGYDDFPRIRIGIGRERQGDLVSYVIGGFSKEEKPLLEESVDRAAEAIRTWLEEGIDAAMNRYNGKL